MLLAEPLSQVGATRQTSSTRDAAHEAKVRFARERALILVGRVKACTEDRRWQREVEQGEVLDRRLPVVEGGVLAPNWRGGLHTPEAESLAPLMAGWEDRTQATQQEYRGPAAKRGSACVPQGCWKKFAAYGDNRVWQLLRACTLALNNPGSMFHRYGDRYVLGLHAWPRILLVRLR